MTADAFFPPRLSLAEATSAVLNGDLIAFPTETFYGIGCNAMDADAVGRVFSLKRRSLALPLPVIISSRDMLAELAVRITEPVNDLMDAFWPGPLSIILPARLEVPDLLTAGASRVAVRYSPHPAALNLCRATGKPLVASSANISGRSPVAAPEHLDPELTAGLMGLYAEGPAPSGTLPSTVVEVRDHVRSISIRILRPGAITRADLERAGFTAVEPVAAV